MSVIAIIPARGGSKAIPYKNIIDFCGKPLLAWSVIQAVQSRLVDEVYVSSDSQEILAVAEQYGAKTITRPAELSGDEATSESALLHALEQIEQSGAPEIDLVVFLQATSPLRKAGDIDTAIETFRAEGADSLFSSSELEGFFIYQRTGDTFQGINIDYHNRPRRQDAEPQYLENGSIYVFKPSLLKQKQNRLGGKIATFVMPFWQSFEIDTPEDLELCRLLCEAKLKEAL